MNSAQLTLDLFGDLGRAVHGTVRLLVGHRLRNCAACDHEESCRQLVEQWGQQVAACRRKHRDECFLPKGTNPLRTCGRCGTGTYMPYCHGCGQLCHCGGDIDDCCLNDDDSVSACTHCATGPDREDDDPEGCCYQDGQCCMPGPHRMSECHTAEMIEDQFTANADLTGSKQPEKGMP
jgi:hypothetical protein